MFAQNDKRWGLMLAATAQSGVLTLKATKSSKPPRACLGPNCASEGNAGHATLCRF